MCESDCLVKKKTQEHVAATHSYAAFCPACGNIVMASIPVPDAADLTRLVAIDAAFAAFDAEHPEVYRLFEKFADQARFSGIKRYSADAILHRIRWHCNIDCGRRGWNEFKIDNNFSSRYSRKLMTLRPDFEGFFALRELKTGAAT